MTLWIAEKVFYSGVFALWSGFGIAFGRLCLQENYIGSASFFLIGSAFGIIAAGLVFVLL
jgi:hypothetical protein